MRKMIVMVPVVGGTLLALMLVGSYLGSHPHNKNGAAFSVETTAMGRLMDTPCTRALFENKLGAGELVNSPLMVLIRPLTLRQLSALPPAHLGDLKLKAVQMELSRLDPYAADCQRHAH